MRSVQVASKTSGAGRARGFCALLADTTGGYRVEAFFVHGLCLCREEAVKGAMAVASAFERGDLNGQIWKPGCRRSKARETLLAPADGRGGLLGGEWPLVAVLPALIVLRRVPAFDLQTILFDIHRFEPASSACASVPRTTPAT